MPTNADKLVTGSPQSAAPTVSPDRVAGERLGLALAGAAAILFGTSYAATKLALVSFSPIAIGAWRGVGAVLLVVVILRARSGASLRIPREPDRLLRLVVLGALGGPGLIVGMNLAVASLGATVAAFVAGLYAVLAAVFAPFLLRERLGTSALVGFVAALLGTALLADVAVGVASLGGLVAGLCGAVSYALFLVLSRRWGSRQGGVAPVGVVTLAVFAMTSLVLVPLDLVTDPGGLIPERVDPLAVAAIGWLVIFPSVLANVLIQGSVQRIPARRSSSLLLLNPISASVIAAALFGERLTVPQLVGAALVVAGIAISNGLVPLRGPLRPWRGLPHVALPLGSFPLTVAALALATLTALLGVGAAGTITAVGGAAPTPVAATSPPAAAPVPAPSSPPAAAPVPAAYRFPTQSPPAPGMLRGYRWPLAKGRLTGDFGAARGASWVVEGRRFHDGIDIASYCGAPIVAAHDGVVLAAGRRYDRWIGWLGDLAPYEAWLTKKGGWSTLPITVVVDDGNGYRSIYAHFSRATVKRGARVRAGQLIGFEGSTGNSSGCHLHYGIFSPLETATFSFRRDLATKWSLPAKEIARIDPFLVLPPMPPAIRVGWGVTPRPPSPEVAARTPR